MQEGYGITECSPVISGNTEEDPRPGSIGVLLRSVEHAIVDLDSGTRVEPGKPGMLLVRGPSVFGGYLHYEGPSPFQEFEGKSWYRTGDLVRRDPDGIFYFAGRLKRFVKLGGEMVSLPAVEEALLARFGRLEDEEIVLAVEATPVESNPELVLFTLRDISRESGQRRHPGCGALAHPQHPAGEAAGEDPRAGHRQDRLPGPEGAAGLTGKA